MLPITILKVNGSTFTFIMVENEREKFDPKLGIYGNALQT